MVRVVCEWCVLVWTVWRARVLTGWHRGGGDDGDSGRKKAAPCWGVFRMTLAGVPINYAQAHLHLTGLLLTGSAGTLGRKWAYPR